MSDVGQYGRRILDITARLLFALAVAAALSSGAHAQSLKELRTKFQEQLRLAHERGIPTKPSELERLAYVPDDQNAAPLYRKAFDPMWAKKSAWRIDSFNPEDARSVKAARAQLAPFRATLAQLRIASKKPGCYFKRDWAKFDSPAFPLLGSFKLAAKAFCMSARLNALDGKAEEAASDLEAAARMTRHLGNSFEILSQLVSLALGAIIDNYAWQIVLDRPDDASFIVAGRAIAVLGSPPSLLRRFGDQVATPSRLVRAYEAEFRDYIFAYDFALDYFGACSWQFQDMLPGFAKAISDDLLDYEASILALEVIRKRYAALLAGPELGPRAKSRQQEITTWFGDQKGGVYKEAREWDIDLTNNVEGSTTALARSRAILAGIAILRARASGGHFPETLPDLGELGIDPLTDNPWLYKREGAGFRLRSPATRHTEHWGDRPLVEIIFPRPAVAGK